MGFGPIKRQLSYFVINSRQFRTIFCLLCNVVRHPNICILLWNVLWNKQISSSFSRNLNLIMHKLVFKPMHYALGSLLHNFPPPTLVPGKTLCIMPDMHYENMHYENLYCIYMHVFSPSSAHTSLIYMCPDHNICVYINFLSPGIVCFLRLSLASPL